LENEPPWSTVAGAYIDVPILTGFFEALSSRGSLRSTLPSDFTLAKDSSVAFVATLEFHWDCIH